MATILIVDDSPTVCEHVRRELERDGHHVDQLRAFIELPRYLARIDPDLILLDLEMPALSGLAFGRFIRQNQQRPVPILVYSARPVEEMELAANHIQAHGVVPKSTSSAELRRAVGMVLEGVRS